MAATNRNLECLAAAYRQIIVDTTACVDISEVFHPADQCSALPLAEKTAGQIEKKTNEH